MRPLIVYSHPNTRISRVNRVFLEAARTVEDVEIRDLYTLYPTFFIRVREEQVKLLESDVIIFQHPFYWYSCPPLMKQWIDQVLEEGFAYGPNGTQLKGKYWLQVISSGAPQDAYGRQGAQSFAVEEFLRPFEQTARLCGMIPLKPVVLHQAEEQTNEKVIEAARAYKNLILKIRDGHLPEKYSTI